jgi:hypothetical protein
MFQPACILILIVLNHVNNSNIASWSYTWVNVWKNDSISFGPKILPAWGAANSISALPMSWGTSCADAVTVFVEDSGNDITTGEAALES